MTAAAQPVQVTRPVLRWHGGKFRIAPWIIKHFPEHLCYVEPYGGAASVLLRKPASKIEVLNDADQRLIGFFHTLRERHDELVRAIRLTPYARVEFENAFEVADDPVEDARRVFVLCWQGRSRGLGEWRTGWRYEVNGRRNARAVDDFRPDHLAAVVQRLKSVQIECGDAAAVIDRYDSPHTLFYIDPPYVWETRSKRTSKIGARYAVEMDDQAHRALAERLHGLQGMVVLSGYPSPLYAELYEAAGWVRSDRTCLTDHGRRVESLWLNPAAKAAVPQRSFDFTAGAGADAGADVDGGDVGGA
jgi:DNA adenine methylase